MLHPNFVFVGLIIATFGAISYIIDILRGRIKPNRVTYFVWSLAAIITFAAEIKQGVGIQSLMTLSVGVFPLLMLVASFANKNAYWKLTRFDFVCGVLSLVGLLLWQITKVGNIAIALSIIADLLAALPTARKAYFYPETETAWPWLAAAVNGLFTLLTIQYWTFAHYAFPLYYIIVMVSIYVFVQFKIGKGKRLA